MSVAARRKAVRQSGPPGCNAKCVACPTTVTTRGACLRADFAGRPPNTPTTRGLTNTYGGGWFKTLKFARVFPDRFDYGGDARAFMAGCVEVDNHTHHHAGIGLNRSADARYSLAQAKAQHRETVLADARDRNPERFTANQDPEIGTTPALVDYVKPSPRL